MSVTGDITGQNGWPDGRCDMTDILLLVTHFGQTVPPTSPNFDLTGPAGVPDDKIDMRDIGLAARHFGEY